MRFKTTAALCAMLMATAPSPSFAAVPVRLTGNTAADSTLQRDIVQTITYYGAAFDCAAPNEIRASILNSAMIPSDADYRAPSLRASYEEWDATFCGKTHRFLVSYWPDPQGGSFLKVTYPYPEGAPSAILR